MLRKDSDALPPLKGSECVSLKPADYSEETIGNPIKAYKHKRQISLLQKDPSLPPMPEPRQNIAELFLLFLPSPRTSLWRSVLKIAKEAVHGLERLT